MIFSLVKSHFQNYFIGTLVIGLMIIMPSISPIQSAETMDSWTDDFNDGDMEGWRIEGFYADINLPSNQWPEHGGEASVVDGALTLSGNLQQRNSTLAIHESHVAYGTWSFDMYVNSIYGSSNHSHVYFIDNRQANETHKFDNEFCCYDILASSQPWDDAPDYAKKYYDKSPAFFLSVRPGTNILGYWATDNIDGWNHIDVTRDTDGNFTVYINGTLRIEAKNTYYTESNSFWYTGEIGSYSALDNIVVSETVSEISTKSNSSFILQFGLLSILTLIILRKGYKR